MQFWKFSLGVFVLSLSVVSVSGAANATPPLLSPAETVAAQASVGEVVDKLGDNLMLVYQDRSVFEATGNEVVGLEIEAG